MKLNKIFEKRVEKMKICFLTLNEEKDCKRVVTKQNQGIKI